MQVAHMQCMFLRKKSWASFDLSRLVLLVFFCQMTQRSLLVNGETRTAPLASGTYGVARIRHASSHGPSPLISGSSSHHHHNRLSSVILPESRLISPLFITPDQP